MTFEVVLGIICVSIVLVYGYMWRGPPGRTMNPVKRARYRWATLAGLGWGILILVRIVTHTFK